MLLFSLCLYFLSFSKERKSPVISGEGMKEHLSRLFLGREETCCIEIPIFTSPYFSEDSLCMDLCPTELRTVKFQLLTGTLQLGQSRLQQERCGMKQVASKKTLHPCF